MVVSGSDKRVFELGFYLERLISDKAIFESAGFGFESRGAHPPTELSYQAP